MRGWMALLFAIPLVLSGCMGDQADPDAAEYAPPEADLSIPTEPSEFSINVTEGLYALSVESDDPFRLGVFGGLPESWASRGGTLGLMLVPEHSHEHDDCGPLHSDALVFFRQLPGDEFDIYRDGPVQFDAGNYRMYVFADTPASVTIGFNWGGTNDRPEPVEVEAARSIGGLNVVSPVLEESLLPLQHSVKATGTFQSGGATVALTSFTQPPLLAVEQSRESLFTTQGASGCSHLRSTSTVCPNTSPTDACRTTVLNHAFLREPGEFGWEAQAESLIGLTGDSKARLLVLEFDEDPFLPTENGPRSPRT